MNINYTEFCFPDEYKFTQFLVTFDFNNEISYLGYRHLIFKLSFKSRTSLAGLIMILYTDYDIALLFLNSKNTLSVFSLETIYQKGILSDIISFSLFPDKELLISHHS
ncbi:hypothetical protein HZS_3852 [Henneguya salminicola]|nr:hypothetical protein HZS_3852 [Henneguya salminicola]